MRVLVVDDESTVRVVLRIKLETMGWAVEEADSGEAALAQWRETQPDVVVLDHRMTGDTGLEVARRLRDEGYDRTIVLYSAYLTSELERQARASELLVVPKTQFSDLVQILQEKAKNGDAGG